MMTQFKTGQRGMLRNIATRAWIAGALLVAAPLGASTEEQGTKFWGHLQRDADHLVSYYLTVPPGQTATLSLDNGYRLELHAASAEGDGDASSVKLYDKAKKELHARTEPGRSPMNVSGSYAICRGSLVFISPAPTEAPGCDD